jgi:hypothetical protein
MPGPSHRWRAGAAVDREPAPRGTRHRGTRRENLRGLSCRWQRRGRRVRQTARRAQSTGPGYCRLRIYLPVSAMNTSMDCGAEAQKARTGLSAGIPWPLSLTRLPGHSHRCRRRKRQRRLVGRWAEAASCAGRDDHGATASPRSRGPWGSFSWLPC